VTLNVTCVPGMTPKNVDVSNAATARL